MVVGTWELASILILLVLIPVLIFLIIRAYKFKKTLNDRVVTRGLSGVGGSTVNLSCPAGQKISVFRAMYICTNPTTPGGGTAQVEDPTCDPFYSSQGQFTSLYNADTTIDVVANPNDATTAANIVQQCNGQEKCSFTIPQADPSSSSRIGMCSGKTCTGTVQLVGTYDCVPE